MLTLFNYATEKSRIQTLKITERNVNSTRHLTQNIHAPFDEKSRTFRGSFGTGFFHRR